MCILLAVDGLFELRFSWIWLVRSPHRILEYKYITHGLILEYKILYSSRPYHIHMYISHRAVCDDFRILMIYFPLILTYTFTQRAVYNM